MIETEYGKVCSTAATVVAMAAGCGVFYARPATATALTSSGWALLEAAVDHAVDGCPV